jgi:hypothetical protein
LRLTDLKGNLIDGLYDDQFFEVVVEEKESVSNVQEHYAAAFNAWMNDYTNNPQAFEDSHTTAIRHLTEKLNGEEPSYGQLSAELFQDYLNKVSNTTRKGV